MILDSLTKLEAVLAGAVAANQPEVHVSYRDWNKEGMPTPPALFRVALNSSTDVTILAAPTFNPIREVERLSIYNKDTASVTVTVKTDDGTERILIKATLLTLESLNWEKGQGWYALDANGNRKEVTSSVFSTLTVTGNATVGGTLGVTGISTLPWVPKAITYTNADTTPSVLNASFMSITNSGATTITNFDDGVEGQVIVLFFVDGNTTIDRSNAYLEGGANFTSSANDTMTLIKVGSTWKEVARSVNA